MNKPIKRKLLITIININIKNLQKCKILKRLRRLDKYHKLDLAIRLLLLRRVEQYYLEVFIYLKFIPLIGAKLDNGKYSITGDTFAFYIQTRYWKRV